MAQQELKLTQFKALLFDVYATLVVRTLLPVCSRFLICCYFKSGLGNGDVREPQTLAIHSSISTIQT